MHGNRPPIFEGIRVISDNWTGSERITQHGGTFMQPLLQWKSNEYYTACLCICNLRYPACNAHAPYLWPARPDF